MIYTYLKGRDFRNAFVFLQNKLDAGFENAPGIIEYTKRYTTLSPEHIDDAYFGYIVFSFEIHRLFFNPRLESISFQKGKSASLSLLNVILECCAQIGDLSRCHETFKEIERTFHTKPNIRSYNALLKASFRSKTDSFSDKIIDQIFDQKVQTPDSTTCELVAQIYAQRRDVKRSLAFFSKMQGDPFYPSPTVDHFAPLVMRETREGNIEFVHTVLDSLTKDGFDTRKLYHYLHRNNQV